MSLESNNASGAIASDTPKKSLFKVPGLAPPLPLPRKSITPKVDLPNNNPALVSDESISTPIPAVTSASTAVAQTDSIPTDTPNTGTTSLTVFTTGLPDPVNGGEGGFLHVSNAEFNAAIFHHIPEGAFAAVCSKPGDPTVGGWVAKRADIEIDNLSPNDNNFLNCSSFYPGDDGSFKAQKGQFAACHVLMLDDLGTKAPFERLGGFKLSFLIETSPGNYQGGIILTEPITDGAEAVRLHNALIAAGLCDAGASGPQARWIRLPVAINGKAKHADESGAPFKCRLVEFHHDARYTPDEIVDGLQLELAPAGRPKKEAKPASGKPPSLSNDHDDVWFKKPAVNPVLVGFKSRGLYKTPLGSGKHDVTCPWVHEHTDSLDNGTAYWEPDDTYPIGGFCCQHSHREQYRIRQVLEFLGVDVTAARHKPVIRIVAGELHRVVNAAEQELAARGRHYQFGGLIASISTDPTTGDPAIVPTSQPALTKELSIAVTFEVFNARAGYWVPCDPPPRHTGILYDSQTYRYLLPLAGVVRQPYFRESDGVLITEAGYDSGSQRFGVFDSRQFVIPEPTPDAAREALAMLEELLVEFHFVTATDKAAALSAILTAVVRATLDYAPGYHAKAPVMGSGKTYLCELIGAFAGPGGNNKVSYPSTSEEATKVMLALLITSPAVIEFDDMDTDWIPHGTIKRMLTPDKITDRILGVSKTATVSTRTLFLGSGNNVGPIRDLLRRVITIHIDPRCATPSTMSYKGFPVDKVRKNRGVYVAAVLTIILAWRKAGCPRAPVDSIVTFGGSWSDYCRQPLMWLGHPDPATSLMEQVKHDPDAETLSGLMREWHKAFGSIPTTIRKAVTNCEHAHPDLFDAIREFPVEERGVINRSKLGWLLKKNANRIVGGFEFQQAEADGRVAWRVLPTSTLDQITTSTSASTTTVAAPPASASTPVLSPLPPSGGSVAETVTPLGKDEDFSL